MPVHPDSRFAKLAIRQVQGPRGRLVQVVSLRLQKPATANQLPQVRLQGGEGIDLFARRVLGGEGLWWRILDANPLVYPLDLEPGDLLNIPEPGQATRATRARRF